MISLELVRQDMSAGTRPHRHTGRIIAATHCAMQGVSGDGCLKLPQSIVSGSACCRESVRHD